jgi:hypothetical protein
MTLRTRPTQYLSVFTRKHSPRKRHVITIETKLMKTAITTRATRGPHGGQEAFESTLACNTLSDKASSAHQGKAIRTFCRSTACTAGTIEQSKRYSQQQATAGPTAGCNTPTVAHEQQ